MTAYVQFALLGLGAGALYAILAQGLILAHRGAGVVNFAHGAMALFVAYVYRGLTVDGQIPVPPLPNPLRLLTNLLSLVGIDVEAPDIPTMITLGGPVNRAVAFFISMAVAAALGGLIHLLVFRYLRAAPPLAKTVAAVGLLLTLQGIVALRFGTENRSIAPILPQTPVEIAGATIPIDRLLMCGIAVLVAVALALVSQRTRLGLQTQAAAQNERAAMLIGLSPNRLAAVNWMLSAMLAGAAGILFASMTGLNPIDLVLHVIPALGAALLARLTSFGLALGGGLLIGILQSLSLPAQADFSWFPSAGAAAGVPLVVIGLVMILRGDRIPTRGEASEIRLPRCLLPQRPLRKGLVVAALAVVALLLLPFDLRGGLINSLGGIVLALSLVVVVGMAGQVSLMQMAIAGFAGFAMTRIAGDWGIPFPLAPLLATTAAAAFGFVSGLPALRVRGVHLAVLTLAAAYAFEAMVLGNRDVIRLTDATGSVPSPSLFGLDFGINSSFPTQSGPPSAWFGLFSLVVAFGCCAGVVHLRRSELGGRMLAIRGNERAAASLGVNVAATKALAFAIAAFLAGLGGSMTAYRFEGISVNQYVAMTSLTLLAMAYLGGISTIWGAVVAGVLITGGFSTAILHRIYELGQHENLIAGVGLIMASVLHPEGISGAGAEIVEKVRRRFARGRAEVDRVDLPSGVDVAS